jgi:hypothetical protein
MAVKEFLINIRKKLDMRNDLYEYVTLDGVVEAPMAFYVACSGDHPIADFGCDALLLGRVTYDIFALLAQAD